MNVWENHFPLSKVTAVGQLQVAPEEYEVEFENVSFTVQLGSKEKRIYAYGSPTRAKRDRDNLLAALYGQE